MILLDTNIVSYSFKGDSRAIALTISANDAWIAATVLHYQLTLITHNPKDFQHIPHLKIQTILTNKN